MTFSRALSTNNYGPAKFIVDGTTVANGTHSTIATALTSASSGDTIFIRPGTYTENLTLKAGVNLTAYGCDSSLNTVSNVIILGKCTMTTAGTVNISGIQLKTNSDFFLAVTGSANSIVNLNNCFLNCSNNTGISYTTSGTSSAITAFNCYGDIGTTGISVFASSGSGNLTFNYCNISNSGGATTASTSSAGALNLFYTEIACPITTSGTSALAIRHSNVDPGSNTIALTVGGSGSNEAMHSRFDGATTAAITVSSTLQIHECNVISSNGAVVTGAGTITYTLISSTNATTDTMSITNTNPRSSFSGGISFDKGTNVFNTYSTGTWTPTIVPSGTAYTSITYSTQVGTWTKIGNLIYVQGNVTVSAITVGAATGDLTLPLPFAVNASPASSVFTGTLRIGNVVFVGDYLYSVCAAGDTAVRVQLAKTASAETNIGASAVTSTTDIAFNIFYRY
jgi:hypothetical protein